MSTHETTKDFSLPTPSPRWVRYFSRYVRWYFRRHFRAVRVTNAGVPSVPTAESAVVFVNHPAWWDPLLGVLLATGYFPERTHFAPMDADMLAKFGLFRKLGFFGVERGTARGARDFLTVSRAVLDRDDAMLWLTPQGRFADARERPPRLAAGLSRLAAKRERGWFVPLAVEYVFWDERLPEALAHFGTPVPADATRSADVWHALLEQSLADAQDALAVLALRRDPSAFTLVQTGRTGTGGVYGVWERVRGWFR